MSFLTGYQEHPGAADSNILDTYSLKSNNVYGMYMRLRDEHRFVRVPETNQTHIICIGGEPRHGHFSNTETAVQIAAVKALEAGAINSFS